MRGAGLARELINHPPLVAGAFSCKAFATPASCRTDYSLRNSAANLVVTDSKLANSQERGITVNR